MLDMFKKSFKGEAPLWQAFWIVNVLVGIVLYIVIYFIAKAAISDFAYPQDAQKLAAIMIPYTLFAMVCVWRCGKNSSTVWNVITKILVVINLLGVAMTIFQVVKGA